MRRRSLLGLVSFAAVAAGAQAAPVRPIRQGDIRVGRFRYHIARAAVPSAAGVLLQPYIGGLDADMRAAARAFAEVGLNALVWDPYDGHDVAPDMASKLAASSRLRDADMVRDLVSAVDYMERELRLTKLGAIGWCMGGRTVLIHAAQDHRLKAISAHHPTILPQTPKLIAGVMQSKADYPNHIRDEFPLIPQIACPVQIVRPGHDLCQPEEYEKLRIALEARHYPTLFEYYPDAEHGFEQARQKPANAAAYSLAWPSTLAFFKAALG